MASLVSRNLIRASNFRCLQQLCRRGFADEASTGGLALTFGTPHQMFFSGQGVNQVDVPSTTGSFGILPYHVPVIAALSPGVVTVYGDGKPSKYFVSSGTITVNTDSTCQILAEEAAVLEDLDLQAARQGLEKAQTQLSSSVSEEDRAKATVNVEFHETIVKALE